MLLGPLRERLGARGSVGGGDHHVAGPCQHDLSLGHYTQHRGVLRLDRPNKEKAGERRQLLAFASAEHGAAEGRNSMKSY